MYTSFIGWCRFVGLLLTPPWLLPALLEVLGTKSSLSKSFLRLARNPIILQQNWIFTHHKQKDGKAQGMNGMRHCLACLQHGMALGLMGCPLTIAQRIGF
jgi:hypothetical protein